MIKKRLFIFFLLAAVPVFLSVACSDDENSPTGASANVVDNPLPLDVGNRWDYLISQEISMDTDDNGTADFSASSAGYQSVSITRTEAFSEGEAFGLEHYHLMQRLQDPSVIDTTIEVHYLAPVKDKILLKAIETVQNNSGGFIPFSSTRKKDKAYTRISVGGNEIEITLDELGRLLLEPLPAYIPGENLDALLASDGIQNSDNVIYYDFDYTYVYDELYNGQNWVSAEALGVGGVEISQRVTNVLDELDGFEGPIAEVTLSNTFIDFYQSDQLKIRYYYKSGIGIIRAEIYDPAILIFLDLGDGNFIIGEGTWAVLKQLAAYTVK